MPFGHHIIVNEIDAFIVAVICIVAAISMAIGWFWGYRDGRCCRTLFNLVGGPPEIDWTGFTAHDALDDAVGQAMQVQKAMGILGR